MSAREAGREDIESVTFSERLRPFHVWYLHTSREPLKELLTDEMKGLPDDVIAKFAEKAGFGNGKGSEHIVYVAAHNEETNETEIYTGNAIVLENGKVLSHNQHRVNSELTGEAVTINMQLNELRLEHDTDWKGIRSPSVLVEGSTWREVWQKMKATKGMLEAFQAVFKGNETAPEEPKAVAIATKDIPNAAETIKALEKKFGKKNIKALAEKIEKISKGKK